MLVVSAKTNGRESNTRQGNGMYVRAEEGEERTGWAEMVRAETCIGQRWVGQRRVGQGQVG